jgi:hypothetical protein
LSELWLAAPGTHRVVGAEQMVTELCRLAATVPFAHVVRQLRESMWVSGAECLLSAAARVAGDVDEATRWFAESRRVLDDAGARALRAVVDYDEALMHSRLGIDGDPNHRTALLNACIRQFTELGMTGWLRRSHELDNGPARGE